MKKKIRFFNIILVISTLFLSVGYAAINSISIEINGLVSAASSGKNKLYIADVTPVNNNSTSNVNLTSGTFLDSSISLGTDNPSSSSVTFQISLYNNTNYTYQFVSTNYILGSNTYDNENIIFEINNLDENTIIESKNTYTFTITFKYNNVDNITNNTLNSKIKFVFKNTSGMPLNQLILLNEEDTLNTGDGLYNYNNEYYYSGINVNNYVWYNCNDDYNEGENNCERWRIVSINNDNSIKIVKDDVVEQQRISELESTTGFWLANTSEYITNSKIIATGKILFDHKGRRPLDNTLANSYCSSSYNGCHAFSSDINTFTGNYNNQVVDADSLMRLYLEDIYYQYALSSVAKEHIKNHKVNTGLVETNKTAIATLEAESSITSYSNVSLLNVSDYLYCSVNSACHNKNDDSSCINNNWLATLGKQFHLINGKKGANLAQIWTINGSGKLESRDANNEFYLRPVVVLKDSTQALGTGLYDNPYILLN